MFGEETGTCCVDLGRGGVAAFGTNKSPRCML